MTDHTQPLPVAAIAALNKGSKIEAIKIVRRERGTGLKGAKDAVDEYLRGQPALQASLVARQASARECAAVARHRRRIGRFRLFLLRYAVVFINASD